MARLTRKVSIDPRNYLFTFEVDRRFPKPLPGQFVQVASSIELTLRRPFSVAGASRPGEVELLVELRGKGTRTLAARHEGSTVSLLGPMGNTFSEPSTGEVAVLVAGGIGVAGLRYLAHELAEEGKRLVILVGARTRDALLLGDLLPSATEDDRVRVAFSTDDGSAGHWGTVCELLESELDALGEDRIASPRLYCCGPPAMLREAAAIAAAREIPCEVLLEEIMACGTGACRGCVVMTKHGYRTVCSDGPVFDAAELVFEEAPNA
jgi:dihydroorotate dehydrogenase electron transfer subunit